MNTNSSIKQLNELPKYFAIKKDYDNLYLWNKYITWLNKTYDVVFSGDSFSYYGYDGFSADWFSNINSFRNPVTEITLEQWDNIVNKKDKFLLPEKWCVKVTKENKSFINKWKQEKNPNSEEAGLFAYYTNYKGNNTYLIPEYKEITFEQFKKYVLKQENEKNMETKKYNPITDDEFIVDCSQSSKYEKMKVYDFLIKKRNYPESYLTNEANFIACNKDFGDTNWTYINNVREKFPNHPILSFKEFKEKYLNIEIIGYKLVKEKYKESVKKILNTPKFPLESSPELLDFKIDSEWYYLLKEAGVLDLWFEPVYEEQKTLPKINGYQGEFVDDLNGAFIKYGCATFNVQFINELHGLIGRNKVLCGNKDIKSIKLNSDVEITTEQIKQIYEYIQENYKKVEKKLELEKAAESYSEEVKRTQLEENFAFIDFINGAKYQAKRMYSEEEVLELLNKRVFDLKHKKDTKTNKEWFEQFKKK
jgi:hypothetical protein